MLAEQATITSRNETNRNALPLTDRAKPKPAIFSPTLNPASKSEKQPTTLSSRRLFTFAQSRRRDQTPDAFIIRMGTVSRDSDLVCRLKKPEDEEGPMSRDGCADCFDVEKRNKGRCSRGALGVSLTGGRHGF